MISKKIRLATPEEILAVLGERNANLEFLERELRVRLFTRTDPDTGGLTLTVKGSPARTDKALKRLRLLLDGSREEEESKLPPGLEVPAGQAAVRPRNDAQRAYLDAISACDLVVAIGPAGTGKTFLAAAAALKALRSGAVNRIVLTRPLVEAGERLGFLPGDISEKVRPFLKPLYDAFHSLLGPEKFRLLREDEIIETIPLAYMRGRTIENAFIILDEAQNTTPEQMKMFLTRMGLRCKMVVTGDITQIDLEDKRHSGLVIIKDVLKGVKGVRMVGFSNGDVLRHPLAKDILQAYEKWEKEGPLT